MRVHHVGVASDDLDGLCELYGGLLDVDVAHEETFDGMRVAFLDAAGTYLELLEPEGDGPIASYVEERGPGIHHVAFATDDLEEALSNARDLGVALVDEEPRPGAWGHEVAFLHPASTGGVLIEFVAD